MSRPRTIREVQGAPGGVPCRDAISLLTEYIEGDLSSDITARLLAHMSDCAPCVEYMETLKKARDAAARVRTTAIPERVRQELRKFLQKEIKRTRS